MFKELLNWFVGIDWAGLWNSFPGLILLLVGFMILVVCFAAVFRIYRWLVGRIGPPYIKMDPETLYFPSILGQILPFYLMNSKVFKADFFGNLELRDSLDGLLGWFHWGAYRFVLTPICWPLAKIEAGPYDLRQFSKKMVVESAETKGKAGRPRTVIIQVTYWLANPFHVYFGRAPKNWEEAFETRVIGAVANIIHGIEEDEVEDQGRLQAEIDKVLLGRGFLSWLTVWRRRPADAIARDTGVRIGNIAILNIQRSPEVMRAAEIRWQGEERAYVMGLFFEKYYQLAERAKQLPDKILHFLEVIALGGGSGGEEGHGPDVEFLAKLGGEGGGGEEEKPNKRKR